jgi:prepilin-type N-terminal cleavage/methylation domain-containing protein
MMQTRNRQSGMTMMELLAVLVIIGVVMGVVGSKFFGQAEEAKRKAA